MSYLSEEQIQHFRARLESSRATARSILHQGSGSKPVEAAGKTIGRLSRMDAIQVQAMEQMSRHQVEIRLKQAEASLAALEAGTYGLCRNCKGPIATERLEVLPEAPFCMRCQEGFEAGG